MGTRSGGHQMGSRKSTRIKSSQQEIVTSSLLDSGPSGDGSNLVRQSRLPAEPDTGLILMRKQWGRQSREPTRGGVRFTEEYQDSNIEEEVSRKIIEDLLENEELDGIASNNDSLVVDDTEGSVTRYTSDRSGAFRPDFSPSPSPSPSPEPEHPAPKAPTVPRGRGRPAKNTPEAQLPNAILIPLMVVVKGAESLVNAYSTDTFDTIRERVAEKLDKFPESLKLRYRVGWAATKSERASLNGPNEWQFLLDKLRSHLISAIKRHGDFFKIPPWSVSIYDEEEELLAMKPKATKATKEQKEKTHTAKEVTHTNSHWARELANKYQCSTKAHDGLCYVVTSEIYGEEFKDVHLRFGAGILLRWAREIESCKAGLGAVPEDLMKELLSTNRRTANRSLQSSKARNQAQGLFPLSFFPPLDIASLQQLALLQTNGGRPALKRTAEEAGLNPNDDGPSISNWLPLLDTLDDESDVSYKALVPKFANLRIRFVADLLEFTPETLSQRISIPIGDSMFILCKARAIMQQQA
ncbi:hypothetical protein FRC17_004656 [Serendipita sp. 399]|nr:hypothetical protein FRC17_004656 [Serendipita sp. 399]